MGSQKIYNFIDGNPQVLMKDVEYTNDPFIIAQQPRMTSINSAIQVDLSGQVCADSLGDKIYSGVGGQIDFVYGASRAKGGKAIYDRIQHLGSPLPALFRGQLARVYRQIPENQGGDWQKSALHVPDYLGLHLRNHP